MILVRIRIRSIRGVSWIVLLLLLFPWFRRRRRAIISTAGR